MSGPPPGHPPASRPGTPGRTWLGGLTGSGKSTVGRALAASLGCRYTDNDVTVHALAGRLPVDLAAAGGTLLHDWESRYVWRVSELSPPLVAGIPASAADRPADLALLAGTGRLIYLRCGVPALVRRVSADPPRPCFGPVLRMSRAGYGADPCFGELSLPGLPAGWKRVSPLSTAAAACVRGTLAA